MGTKKISRRDFLVSGALTLGAAALAGCQGAEQPIPTMISSTSTSSLSDITKYYPTPVCEPTKIPQPEEPQPVLRIAHLTDMHILPEEVAKEGLARAIRQVQRFSPKPDFILNTGDCIMDGLRTSKEEALNQWKTFLDIFSAECSIPVYHCIGNHDVWGWGSVDPAIQADELYGKEMALQQLQLESPYYSFDQGGWHFIILDSTYPLFNPNLEMPYSGKLDEAQYLWLEAELNATPSGTPVCIASHIPILAACEYFDGPNEESGNWIVPGAWMHIDARRMRNLFLQHSNVRLCLSGHTHQLDHEEYLKVKYLSNGAISGNWWKGDYMDFPPAYVLLDLYANGTSQYRVYKNV